MNPNRPSRPFLRLVGEAGDLAHGAWRDDSTLVISRQAALPDRCVVCNQPADGHTVDKTLLWHTPMLLPLLVLVPVGIVIYVALAFFFKKTMPVAVPLCARHRRRRKLLTVAGIALLPAFPVLVAVGISASETALIPVGILLSIAGIVALVFARNELWPLRITDEHAYVRGAHAEWLDALPQWVEPGA